MPCSNILNSTKTRVSQFWRAFGTPAGRQCCRGSGPSITGSNRIRYKDVFMDGRAIQQPFKEKDCINCSATLPMNCVTIKVKKSLAHYLNIVGYFFHSTCPVYRATARYAMFLKFENNIEGRARLWDTALKFLSPIPRVTSPDHLEICGR